MCINYAIGVLLLVILCNYTLLVLVPDPRIVVGLGTWLEQNYLNKGSNIYYI
jgi:hypothetical protein